MKAYSVGEEALLKVLLHAAKHPTSAVNGLLLGTCGAWVGARFLHIQGRASSAGLLWQYSCQVGACVSAELMPSAGRLRHCPRCPADEGAVRVTDAVPVCHSFVTLTPIIEAAMSQASGAWAGLGPGAPDVEAGAGACRWITRAQHACSQILCRPPPFALPRRWSITARRRAAACAWWATTRPTSGWGTRSWARWGAAWPTAWTPPARGRWLRW